MKIKGTAFDIVLFTSKTEDDLHQYTSTKHPNFFDFIDYVKVGKYDNTQLSGTYIEPVLGIKLASTNQKVINLKDELDACLIKHEYKERK